MDKLAYTVAEACEQIGVSSDTFWKLLAADEIRVVRMGRSVRVPAAELGRWVRERTEQWQPHEAGNPAGTRGPGKATIEGEA